MKPIVICEGENCYKASYQVKAWMIRNGLSLADIIVYLRELTDPDKPPSNTSFHIYKKYDGYLYEVGQMTILKGEDSGTTIRFYSNLLYRELNPSIWKRVWNAIRRTK